MQGTKLDSQSASILSVLPNQAIFSYKLAHRDYDVVSLSLYALTIRWLVKNVKRYARDVSLPHAPRTLIAKSTERRCFVSVHGQVPLIELSGGFKHCCSSNCGMTE
jgi:hypothetical protein